MASPQPCLPGVFGPAISHAHKRARQTSREIYRRQRAEDIQRAINGQETREGQVLRLLAAFWNRYQFSPTALEVMRWGQEQGEPLFDVNSVRPRITALVAAGLVEPRARRVCQVSGKTVWTWACREIGSREPC